MHQGNSIDVAEVNAALAGTALADLVRHFPQVHSTNDLALEAAQAGESYGVWVADAQTAGRGRGDHQWHSTPGDGLYVSALFSPTLPASVVQLSLAAGLAAWDAIREVTGIVVDLRWPNDLVTREPVGIRKLGGVLIEAAVTASQEEPARLRHVVVGIGINVAHRQFSPELTKTATSLHLEGWQQPERQPLLIALLQHLCRNIRGLEDEAAGSDHGPDVLERWGAASTWLRGKHVHVAEDGGYTGVTAGLDARGFLLVDDATGGRHTVRSGGVRAVQPQEATGP